MALTKSGLELILGYSPQTLITGVVRELYLRNSKHISNKLQCDGNVHTSNVSEEKRYRMINPVHVGVKLLDKHEKIGDRVIT